MAIINCPECNGEISDSVKQCIHCGARITVCPECRTAYVGEIEMCRNCGYVINKDNENQDELKGIKETKEKWQSEAMYRKLYDSNKIIHIISIPIDVIILCFFCITLSNWFKSGISMVENFDETYFSVIVCVIFVGISAVIERIIIDVYAKTELYTNFANWAKNQKISLKSVIRKDLSQDFSRMVPQESLKECKLIKKVITSVALADNCECKNRVLTLRVFSWILYVLSSVFFDAFLVLNFKIFMQATLLKSDLLGIPGWNMSMIEHWWMIVLWVCIGFIGTSILDSKVEKKENSACKEWIENNLPEYIEKYDKYIREPSEQYIDKSLENIGKR